MTAATLPHIAVVTAAWDLGVVSTIVAPVTGTVHQTLLLQATRGDYAVRLYRYRDRQRVEDEHALIMYALGRGIPAVAPVPLPDGATILEWAGRFIAVFPRASGQQRTREELGPGDIRAMGQCLAAMHRALVGFPPTRVCGRSFAVEMARTLARIATLEAAIHARTPCHEVDSVVLAQLAERRSWLLANRDSSACFDLVGLASQVIHGDYQQSNLFFAGDAVNGIIDWDQAYVAPRAWEVIRTLDLVFGFVPQPCRIFLDAYQTVTPLSIRELDRAADAYSIMRAHDLWLYEAVYLEDNERVRCFLPSGHFVPLREPWLMLRTTLLSPRCVV